MRSTWPFVAGILVAAVVTAVTLPIVAVTAMVMAVVGAFGHDDAMLAGTSSFAVHEIQGRVTTRLVNNSYHMVSVAVAGEPRPRRLLLRQQATGGDRADGRVRVDAWPADSVSELRKPPLYTIRAVGTVAAIGDDGMLWTERGGRRSAWSLSSGDWLFDADVPPSTFTLDGERPRLGALSAADDDFSPKGVATISYAAPGRLIRRVLLIADDPIRAHMLRATVSASRLTARPDEAGGGRTFELALAAGPVRVPLKGDDLDLAAATLPAGLRLVVIQQWGVDARP
jgi:hypothetical protein